ncbi:NAD-glutamate dehydrogenase domain-containing protein [Ensifer canadensis]
MFALPRSSWQDYDRKTLSEGGMIISRAEKSVTLTPEAMAAICIDKQKATPFEIMNAILKSQVDLLWFGGIGTYVRGSNETDAEVGDRANDAIRVVAEEVRARVIGEGANLGVTQKGAYRLRPQWRSLQLRRHRQLGGRQLVRRRGQHQDRAGLGDARRSPDPAEAQHAAGVDDRGSRPSRTAQQLRAVAGNLAHRTAGYRKPHDARPPDDAISKPTATSTARLRRCRPTRS